MIQAIDPLVSLPATDPARARAFYRDVIGLRELFGNEDSGFYILAAAETAGSPTLLGVHQAERVAEPRNDGVWIWLTVTELAAARGRLERAGVRLLGDATFLGPGTELPFVDTEGNVLRLYEVLERLERSVEIDASAAEVFPSLVTPAEMERWFSLVDDVRLEPHAGGTISFIDPTFGRVSGRVTRVEQPHLISFEFRENWPTHLEFRLSDLPSGRCRVEVAQWGYDPVRDRDYGIAAITLSLEAGLHRLAERDDAVRSRAT